AETRGPGAPGARLAGPWTPGWSEPLRESPAQAAAGRRASATAASAATVRGTDIGAVPIPPAYPAARPSCPGPRRSGSGRRSCARSVEPVDAGAGVRALVLIEQHLVGRGV